MHTAHTTKPLMLYVLSYNHYAPTKVGVTSYPRQRISLLQREAKVSLSLDALFLTDEALALEQRVKNAFRHRLFKGYEWFSLPPNEIVDLIVSLASLELKPVLISVGPYRGADPSKWLRNRLPPADLSYMD